MAGGPQQRQQAAAHVWSGCHQQQLIAAHAVQDHLSRPQDAWTDAHQAHTAALPQLLEHGQLLAEVVEVHRHRTHPVLLGQLLHGLEEVAAGHHRAVAGAVQHAFELLHRHYLDRHVEVGLQFLRNQHRGTNILARCAHEHPGPAAQPPVDLAGEQVTGLLQGAARIEQSIHTPAHFTVQIGDAAVAHVHRRADFPRLLLVAHINARASHGLDHAVGFQLAVDLADGVAVQSRLHGQLSRARQAMPGWVMPGGDREADLVVELGRRRYVAFLLDVESHAGGPDQDAATIRSEWLGDNCRGGPCPYDSSIAHVCISRMATAGGRVGAAALLVGAGTTPG